MQLMSGKFSRQESCLAAAFLWQLCDISFLNFHYNIKENFQKKKNIILEFKLAGTDTLENFTFLT